MKLSVIMPYVNEWPQVAFTLRSISETLRDRVDYEVIAVDNYHLSMKLQGYPPDRGHDQEAGEGKVIPGHIRSMADYNPWLKYVRYEDKLSHWNAKRVGVAASSGDYLLFLDSHVVPSKDSIIKTLEIYEDRCIDGTIHMPLTYHILESKWLIYKLKWEPEKGYIHYGFTAYDRTNTEPLQVPCMSCCGVMMTRELYDYIGGWPRGLGIYGGGENFLNFTLAVLGKEVWISPVEPLYHHGDKRGYSQNGDDTVRNHAIACHIYGGEKLAFKYCMNRPGDKATLKKLFEQGVRRSMEQREDIKSKMKMTIYEWSERWT